MLDWGNIPTWIGAVGGVLGAVGTVTAVWWAVVSTNRESRLSRSVAANAEAEKVSRATELRRLHAQQVYAWFGEPSPRDTRTFAEAHEVGIYLGNSAAEPVYNVVAYLVWVQGAAYRTGEEAEQFAASPTISAGRFDIHSIRAIVQALPPGQFIVDVSGPDNSPQQGQAGVEVAFTDRAGRHWVRRALGELIELHVDPLDYYNVTRPVRYSSLTR